jgi:protein involved in polysaccharide export with SLBB domain
VVVVTVVCLGVLPPRVGARQAPQMVDPKALPDVCPALRRRRRRADINFFKATQMSTTRTVGPDGEIYLPLVGRVAVFGRTVDDITEELNTRYGGEMVNPQITVSVSQYSGLKVYVGGEVNFPGLRDYRGGLTLVQAVMDAGGFKTTGRQKEVVLIRTWWTAARRYLSTVSPFPRLNQVDKTSSLRPMTSSTFRASTSDVNLFVEQYIN